MVDVKNASFYWLDEFTFVLEFDGGVDEDGDEYSYQVEYQEDTGRFVFLRWYEFDITLAGFSPEEEEYLKSMMRKEMEKGKR